MKQDGSGPCDHQSVIKSFNYGIQALKRKFGSRIRANPGGDYFPEEELKHCRTELRKNHGRTHMEGADASDLYKNTHPQ